MATCPECTWICGPQWRYAAYGNKWMDAEIVRRNSFRAYPKLHTDSFPHSSILVFFVALQKICKFETSFIAKINWKCQWNVMENYFKLNKDEGFRD